MRRTTWHDAHMTALGGEQLRDARVAAGYTDRAAFAALVGVSPRTLEGWESRKGHVPPSREALVKKVLAGGNEPDDYLRGLSDTALIAELARRLAERDSAPRQRQLMQGETDFSEHDSGGSVNPRRTSAQGTAGPHSPPRKTAQ